jgi:hypothetical protein
MIEMQHTLFGPLATSSPVHTEARPTSVPVSRRRGEPDEPELTLFGIVETKKQARIRAQRIVRLIGAIEDVPETLACYENDIRTLEYFIERSARGTLDPNDRDGLLRFVGDLQELLTEDDCREMNDKPEIWKPHPARWLGNPPGELYAAALHPKEIAYLRHLQEERRHEMTDLSAGAAASRSELDKLKAIGPLPDDVAGRYSLTPMGDRLKTAAASKHSA